MANDKPNEFDYSPDLSAVRETEEYKQNQRARKAVDQNNKTRWERLREFFVNGSARFLLGIIFLMLSIYLLITFASFLFSAGSADQSAVVNNAMTENAASGATTNKAGAFGAAVAQFLMADGVGLAAFGFVVWSFVMGYRMVFKKKTVNFFPATLLTLFTVFTASMIIGLLTLPMSSASFFPLGGQFGRQTNLTLQAFGGTVGMVAVNIIIAVLWVLVCAATIKSMWETAKKSLKKKQQDSSDNWLGKQLGTLSGFLGDKKDDDASEAQDDDGKKEKKVKDKKRNKKNRRAEKDDDEPKVAVEMAEIESARGITNPHDPTGEYIHYRFPSTTLLEDIQMKKDNVDVDEQESNKARITETLNNFGIQIKQIEVHVGPTVTLFEIVPQDGTRISKIKNLEDDIALSLAALGIRIIAPMPGRGTIGIEVPNREPQVVPMRKVIESKAFQESNAKLPMVLGCTVSNEVFVSDLTKMPHLLVAGATGQGKSVGLNAIITSLLYKKGPSELKFVLVDPKKVEFSLYADLEKYFFAKVPGQDESIVTDTDRVVATLNSVVQEMENRYEILKEVKERKVEDYNAKWRRELRNIVTADGRRYEYMPYIVVVVDEFSDLIMSAGKNVETPIVRIAQKARAVGIHMIIATQRPSSNVITGLIKANFPGRIAYRVTQMIDSRIILDRPGAQQLIGRGDMLFSANGEITRLQCPLVDTPDVERICEFIKEQEDADTNVNHERPFYLPEYTGSTDDLGGEYGGGGGNPNERDPLFDEVARWIVNGDTASTSSIQRRYSIGYNRAGKIMDQMERAGIVGPSQGGKPRRILVDPMQIDQML